MVSVARQNITCRVVLRLGSLPTVIGSLRTLTSDVYLARALLAKCGVGELLGGTDWSLRLAAEAGPDVKDTDLENILHLSGDAECQDAEDGEKLADLVVLTGCKDTGGPSAAVVEAAAGGGRRVPESLVSCGTLGAPRRSDGVPSTYDTLLLPGWRRAMSQV